MGKVSKTTKRVQRVRASKSEGKAEPAKSKTRLETVAAEKRQSHAREDSKLAGLIAMLRRKEGATLEQMVKVTRWQAHSVRGAMSGALKKKLRLNVTSSKVDGVRTYRIAEGTAS